jgi:WD40 repeat protein
MTDELSVLLRHRAPSDWVTCLAVSADGATLATGGLFDSVYLWDYQTTNLLHTLNPDNAAEYLTGVD